MLLNQLKTLIIGQIALWTFKLIDCSGCQVKTVLWKDYYLLLCMCADSESQMISLEEGSKEEK